VREEKNWKKKCLFSRSAKLARGKGAPVNKERLTSLRTEFQGGEKKGRSEHSIERFGRSGKKDKFAERGQGIVYPLIESRLSALDFRGCFSSENTERE